jgi:CBS domain-containing protein
MRDLPTSLPPETPIREVMSPGVIALSAEAMVIDCAVTMAERRTHAILILDPASHRPRGWISQQDVLRLIGEERLAALAGDALSEAATFIAPDVSVRDAANTMLAEGGTHLLVGSPDAVALGVVSIGDIVAFYARLYGRRH